MSSSRPVKVLCAVVLAVLVSISLVAPAQAKPKHDTIVRIWHPPTTATLLQDEGLGAVRTFLVPIEVNGKSGAGYYMSGTLRTVATQVQGDQELRQANLAFVIGDEANQLLIGGVSLYPPTGSTLAVGQRTVRPLVGGSGTYAGAHGYVVTINRGPQGWEHVFHIQP